MKRRILLYLIDTGIIAVSAILIWFISVIDVNSEVVSEGYVKSIIILYMCIMTMRLLLRNYSKIWRYADVSTCLSLIIADVTGGIMFYILCRLGNSVNIGVIYSFILTLLTLILTLSSRFIYQYAYAYASRRADKKFIETITGDNTERIHKINIAIVGAGNIGATLAGELLRNPRSYYNPYCFFDNDYDKVGNYINGIKVYPEDSKVVDRIKAIPVQEIIIALPDATADERTRLYNLYKETGCNVKIYDYPVGEDTKEDKRKLTMREFRIEDLLFRDLYEVSSDLAKEYYADKTVLVTGGGGSIGSELCRKIAGLSPKKLAILDIYENNAYEIQQELIRKHGNELKLKTIIASVRDEKRLDEVFKEIKPDIVIHAAAHKHVPLMESNSCEAIKNNVIGTYNTANMAEKYGVKKFILISTDKAVNPTNVMGATKRLCEMVIQCRDNSQTEFTAVRFGNVLGSNGSVIPLFKQQIENGGPVTITDKRIIRYFMTIPEAAELVLEAGAMAKNGELFVLDMGKPVKILDLAENMIRLSGYKPYTDIDIVESGLRPGEKLYEELLMKSEELDKTPNKMIFIERDKRLPREEVEEKIHILVEAIEGENNSRRGHHDEVIKAIKATVPTYHDPEEVNRNAEETDEMANVNILSSAVAMEG